MGGISERCLLYCRGTLHVSHAVLRSKGFCAMRWLFLNSFQRGKEIRRPSASPKSSEGSVVMLTGQAVIHEEAEQCCTCISAAVSSDGQPLCSQTLLKLLLHYFHYMRYPGTRVFLHMLTHRSATSKVWCHCNTSSFAMLTPFLLWESILKGIWAGLSRRRVTLQYKHAATSELFVTTLKSTVQNPPHCSPHWGSPLNLFLECFLY